MVPGLDFAGDRAATLTRHKIKGYGWVPDIPDNRDHLYAAPAPSLAKLPVKMDLRAQCPKTIYDQGDLGSCTSQAIAAAIQFDRHKQKLTPDFIPSRLFIYYNERVIEGTVASDNGAAIRDGIKSVATLGDCPDSTWPYDIRKFAVKPSKNAYSQAIRYKAVQYQRVVRNINQFKGCLASGFPFVLGFSVYEAFESAAVAKSGVLDMPAPGEKLIGGHAVLAVGYDDASRRFIVRNSWGPKWGMGGHFTMPYAYLLDDGLSDDFWTIRLIAR